MTKLRYPIGIQTFSNMIEGGYAYVDKTMYIPRLLDAAKFIFLSRPRRFGKSLTLSMLHSYFDADRRLFKGLAVDEMEVEWVKRPVFHIDFNASDYTTPDGLDIRLDATLAVFEKEYDIKVEGGNFATRFEQLIRTAYTAKGEKPAILVDEYDKPLLNAEENRALFEKNQATLKGFFGVLKSMEKDIHFAMLTGVARFSKVSIFSDLNHLRDISMERNFSGICGYTQEELENVYHVGIIELADNANISYRETIDKLRSYYDGYLFAPQGPHLYNPFSVINALGKSEFGRYWFQTATPTFLVKRILKSRILLPSLNSVWCSRWDLDAVGMNDRNPIPLLFQTGYLTIKSVDGDDFELQFPNEEVEAGFAQDLTKLYIPQLDDFNSEFGLINFKKDLRAGKIEDFMLRLQTLIKDIPYEKQDEQLYQNAVYLLFTLLGTDARIEEHSSKGRTDITVRMRDYIYIYEFKYNGSAKEALQQITEKDYAGRFAMANKKIILIGANFSKKVNGLETWIIRNITSEKS